MNLLKTIEGDANLADEIFIMEVFIQDFELHHGHIRNGDIEYHLMIPLWEKSKWASGTVRILYTDAVTALWDESVYIQRRTGVGVHGRP